MANKDKGNVKRFIQDVSAKVANDAYNGGGGVSSHLYQYYVKIDVEDSSHDSDSLELMFISANEYADFDIDESQEATITLAQFVEEVPNAVLAYSNQSGSTIIAIYKDTPGIGIGGWTTFDDTQVTFRYLSGVQVF